MTEVDVELRDRIFESIQHKRWPELDEAWLRVVEGAPFPLHVHEAVIQRLLRKRHTQKLAELYGVLFDTRMKAKDWEGTLKIAEVILNHDPASEFLRPTLIAVLPQVHADRDPARIAEFLKVSGILGETPDLRKTLSRFEELLGATKGQVFRHRTWGLGIARSLDTASGKVVIDFELKKAQTMTLDGVRQFLERIPKDHLLAKMASEPDELKSFAFADPAGLIRLALKSFGSKQKVSDLKRTLTTRFLTEDEYRRWWTKAKEDIKLDPYLDLTGTGVNATLILLSQPRSFLDAVIGRISGPKSMEDLRNAMRDIRLHGEEAELSPTDVQRLHKIFTDPVQSSSTSYPEKLNRGLIYGEFEEIFGELANPFDLDALLQDREIADVMALVEEPDSRRTALDHLLKTRPDDWPTLVHECFVHLDTRSASWAEKELARQGKADERRFAIEAILGRPDKNPELFIWAVRNVFEGTWNLGEGIAPVPLLMEEILALADQYHADSLSEDSTVAAPAKSTLTRLRAFVQEGQGRQMRRVVSACTPEEARKLLTRIQLHSALAAPFKENVERLIIAEHPGLRRASKQEIEEERKKPPFHYTIAESVEKKRMELSHVLSTEIPLSAEAIAVARALGDLRENAEYHAAKDRQKTLMLMAAELEDLIARARIIELDSVQTNVSRFGTSIRLRRLEGSDEIEYTLLGMWESDARQNVLSYLTPLGSQLMNRSVGETFTVTTPDGRKEQFEVLAIERAKFAPVG